jgi:hypothetical protein
MKDAKSLYMPGRRKWLKMKRDYLGDGSMADTADLVVLGGFYGTGNKGGKVSVFLCGVFDKASSQWKTVSGGGEQGEKETVVGDGGDGGDAFVDVALQVCKVGNGHDDKTIDRLNRELDVSALLCRHCHSRASECVSVALIAWSPVGASRVRQGRASVAARQQRPHPALCGGGSVEGPRLVRRRAALLVLRVTPSRWLMARGVGDREITGAEFSASDHHTASRISIRFPRVTKERTDKTPAEATTLSASGAPRCVVPVSSPSPFK